MFKCDMCGECCRNLHKSPIYDELHDGNGICFYLDGNICSIYQDRPLICRVDECYELFFKNDLSYDDYLQLNYESCEILKNQKEE
ncbi:MAG: YkgJ family cysteine cluster protein [Lachnospiraceae bacterium]|nr:YkgJ family cysteine cluster protein [Lachnospiraceae bacterium]